MSLRLDVASFLLLAGRLAAVFLVPLPGTWGQSGHAPVSRPLAIPAITPGNSLAQVEALLGKAEFVGAPENNLRSLNWHHTPMMIHVLVDGQGVVASVIFQLKRVPFMTDDGVIIGRDSLRVAGAKVGDRLVRRSEIGYVVDASCFGASITTRSKASTAWLVTFEALECGEGEQSIEKLSRSPINNVTIARAPGRAAESK